MTMSKDDIQKERNKIDVLIDFLLNSANLEYVPELYLDNTSKAILLIKNEGESYLLPDKREKFPLLKNALKYAVGRVGYQFHLTDSQEQKGKLTISPIIKEVYEIDENKRVRIGQLVFEPKEDVSLSQLSLGMNYEDAAMVFGSKRVEEAKDKVIYAKIELYVEEKKEENERLHQK